MAKERYKQLGMGSFLGGLIYDRVVPRDHFLVNLQEVIDWDAFNDLLIPAYQGLAVDEAAPYHRSLCEFKRRLGEAGGLGSSEGNW